VNVAQMSTNALMTSRFAVSPPTASISRATTSASATPDLYGTVRIASTWTSVRLIPVTQRLAARTKMQASAAVVIPVLETAHSVTTQTNVRGTPVATRVPAFSFQTPLPVSVI